MMSLILRVSHEACLWLFVNFIGREEFGQGAQRAKVGAGMVALPGQGLMDARERDEC
jgi:hypothetical protein